MAFLDDIDRKLTMLGQGAMQKGREMSDTAKISAAIRGLESQKRDCFVQLGQLYYQQYGSCAGGEMGELVAHIQELDEILKQNQSQMQRVKGVIYCPNCNTEIPANSVFCNVCGAKIEAKQDDQTNSQPAQMKKPAVCRQCGSSLEEEQAFCVNCGTKIEQPPVDEEPLILPVVEEEMNQCPKCGAEIAEEQSFCIMCGTKIEPRAAQDIWQEEADSVSMVEMTEETVDDGNWDTASEISGDESFGIVEEVIMDSNRCTNCGKELEADQKFCIHCGTPV